MNLAAQPADLFVSGDEIKVQIWDSFAPVWGPVVKYGVTSTFDEVTYTQMLDDAVARNLCIYMDQDHATANYGWTVSEIPALAYYCSLAVINEGKILRQVNLAGHSCAASVPLDVVSHPVGLHGFRCRITPDGRRELPNYQALSIHFDPHAEDYQGRPVGTSLICVSACNGPHLPAAGPPGGAFSRHQRIFYMADPTKAAGSDASGDSAELAVEMEALRKLLKMPEGSDEKSIIGAALAVLAASGMGEPDGDETPTDGEVNEMAEEMPDAAKSYVDGMDEPMRKYARRACAQVFAAKRALRALSKEVGAAKHSPKAVVSAVLAFKAQRGSQETALARVQADLAKLQGERDEERKATEKAAASLWERDIKALLNAAGPIDKPVFDKLPSDEAASPGDGRISAARAQELYSQAQKFKFSTADLRTFLPQPGSQTFTANGNPASKKDKPAAGGDSDSRVINADQAATTKELRDQYQRDTGKRLTYAAAGQIVGSMWIKGGAIAYSYDKAKAQADRLSAAAFLPKEGK